MMIELSTQEVDEKCDIEKHWEEIGIQLEVDYDILTTIRERHHEAGTEFEPDHDYYDLAFRDMIERWSRKEGSPPTWLNFVEALECLKKFPGFANHLRAKYCTYMYILT